MAPPRTTPSEKDSAATGELRDGFKFRSGPSPSICPHRWPPVSARSQGPAGDAARLGRCSWPPAGIAKSGPTAEELDQARELREVLYRLAVACARGRLRAKSGRCSTAGPRSPRGAATGTGGLTGPAASAPAGRRRRDGVELFGGPLAQRIRECAGEGCALLFVDTSRSGQRRWCSMTGCGNKAKVAEFRRRQREETEASGQ